MLITEPFSTGFFGLFVRIKWANGFESDFFPSRIRHKSFSNRNRIGFGSVSDSTPT